MVATTTGKTGQSDRCARTPWSISEQRSTSCRRQHPPWSRWKARRRTILSLRKEALPSLRSLLLPSLPGSTAPRPSTIKSYHQHRLRLTTPRMTVPAANRRKLARLFHAVTSIPYHAPPRLRDTYSLPSGRQVRASRMTRTTSLVCSIYKRTGRSCAHPRDSVKSPRNASFNADRRNKAGRKKVAWARARRRTG
jgi:hypothetical protein